ncbi:MAG: N-6 DNA methylase [Chitinophagaceae bacterium]|nr:N-6 DNA methylase [Chitinophagaceae bacterium]
MQNIANIYNKLTSDINIEESKHLVLEFAKALKWNPSYFIEPSSEEKSNGYLVVEHGLQNSAIISFLKVRNEDLTSTEENNLLGLSYNNLVNWHITVDSRYINYYYILNNQKRKVETKKIEKDNEADALNMNAFLEVIGKKPNTNIKALDDVLIENISNWKRILSAELNNTIDLISLSHLFNAIIFLRSIEDGKRRTNKRPWNSKIFIETISIGTYTNVSQIIEAVETALEIAIPNYIVSKNKIAHFNEISLLDIKRMVTSFYENEHNNFRYDFSIMTKQALSRIYQKYVSLLYVDNTSPQLEVFASVPTEKINKDFGAYYTPEYVARFFAKYVCKKYTEKDFDSLKILEPAVGSGIFLRTLLETQIEKRISNESVLNVDTLFNNVTGIDIDPNACLSTNLSLTLLHYIFNKTFPKPAIIEGDSLDIMLDMTNAKNKVDVIISNPPFINLDKKEQPIIEKCKAILEGLNNGKVDVYQAFIKLSIDLLNPNGLGLFVLPHNFLISASSKKLRNYLLEHCTIELLADLSSINVFDKVGTYTILLIFRKRSNTQIENSVSWLMKCRSSVGDALQLVLDEIESEEKQYQIYKADNYFKTDGEWYLLNKLEFDLQIKIKSNVKIDNFLKLNQGIVTGKDDIFKIDAKSVSKEDSILYKQYLPDKKINAYSFETNKVELVYFPFINHELISEDVLENLYPKTWNYLLSKKNILDERADVKSNKLLWWKLHSPGKSESVNSPKIVTPYMSITPKFALDIEGNFITFRSPYFILKDDSINADLLYYFLGILNSTPCYWILSLQAQKQSSGYNIFHLNVLKETPVPDPTLADNISLVTRMISTVKKRFIEKNEIKKMELEVEINNIACELYQLTPSEKQLLGI